MKKSSLWMIIGIVFVVLVIGFFVLTNNGNGSPKVNEDPNKMVDCTDAKDPGCFLNRMNQCLPVTAKMIATDGSTSFEITVLGVVNETCHFQRTMNNILSLDCYFPKGTMNADTLDQTFGNDKGLQKVVDDNCKMMGW